MRGGERMCKNGPGGLEFEEEFAGVLAPWKSMLMASGALSRPLRMVCLSLSLPDHFPHAELLGRLP